MSYNGYSNSNDYSPYYQQSQPRDRRSQYQDQSRNSASFQNGAYSPLIANQSTQQPRTSAPQSSQNTAYASQGYGSARSQDSRDGYSNSGRSLDTSALGSLAYASSLGRDNSSFTRNSTGFSIPNPYMNSAGHVQHDTGRIDESSSTATINEAINGRPQQATPTSSYGYNSSVYAGYVANTEAPAQAQIHQTTSQASRASTQSQYANQVARPASGQAIQNTHSRTGSQSSNSALIRADQAISNMVGRHGAEINGFEQNRVQSPLQPVIQSSGTTTGSSTRKALTQQAPFGASRSQLNAQGLPATASFDQQGPAKNAHQSSARDSQGNGDSSRTSTPVGNQYPTTVDPSQVFNHYEYSRRKAIAAGVEAARKKTTGTAQAGVQAKDNALSHARSGSSQETPSWQQNRTPPSQNPHGSDVDPDTAKKMQMELEMKQMIEKMRDYKSKDPSLFSQIWEQVKKSQPAPRAPSQPASQNSSFLPIVVNDRLPSPSTALTHLPPESELPRAQSNELEDRGRFPAPRRRWGGEACTPPEKFATPQNGPAPSTSASDAVGSSVQTPETQNLKKTMEEYHANSNLQNRSISQPPPLTPQTHLSPQHASSSTTTPVAKVPRQPSQPPKQGGTYWPDNRKRALAEAARKALTSEPVNTGKQITTEEIHELLDQNPSYTQMCQILECRGFSIDRGQLARTLLSAVPDLGSAPAPNTQSKPPTTGLPPPPSMAPQSIKSSVPPPVPYPVPPAPPAPPMDHTLQPAPNAGSSTAGAPSERRDYRLLHPKFWTPDERRQHQEAMAHLGAQKRYDEATSSIRRANINQSPHLTPPADWEAGGPKDSALSERGEAGTSQSRNGVKWADKHDFTSDIIGRVIDEQRNVHRNRMVNLNRGSLNASYAPTKQDLARKRSFGEIVDLTQLSDDERPPQRPRLSNEKSLPAATVNGVNQAWHTPHGMVPSNTENIAQDHVASNTSAMGNQTGLNDVKTKPSSRQHLWSDPDIIRPMNKRQDALRRPRYDPKTIARDLLVAIGRHPEMAPLNSHLDILREKFKAVNYDSDLSSFRWDLVDPGDPAKAEKDGDANDADDEKPYRPSSRSLASRHQPRIAVVVGADTGVGGASIPVGSSMSTPSKDTATRRRRGRPSRGGYTVSSVRSRPEASGASTEHRGAPDQQESPQNQDHTSHLHHAIPHSNNSQLLSRFMYTDPSTRTPSAISGVQVPTSFGPSNKTTAGGIPQSRTQISTLGSDAVPKRKGRPPGAKNKEPLPDKGIPQSKPSDQTSKNSNHPMPSRPRIGSIVTTPVKPSGLRNAMTPTDGIAVVVQSRSPSISSTPKTELAK